VSELRVLEVLGRSAGGVARHVARVVDGLDGCAGFELEVAAPADLPIVMPKLTHRVLIPDGPVRGHARAVAALRSALARGNYGVVHAHGLRAGIDTAVAARLAARVRAGRTPVIVSVHNLMRPEILGRRRAFFYARAESLAVRLSDRTFAPSVEIAGHLKATIPSAAGKIEVLHLGVGDEPEIGRPPSDVRRNLGLSERDRVVVTAARLSPQKALDVMLRAVAQLSDDVILVVLGKGPEEMALKALTNDLGIAERVRWVGFRDDVADHVNAAEVFCLSSKWEAVALAAQEAVLVGTPVVSTEVGGMSELFEDRVSARLVPPEDPDRLAAALREVLESPDDGVRYAEAARKKLAKDFSTADMLARLREAYIELSTGPR
jgi:glycosyltransferase involved in cell wall biosynthesis